MRTLRRLIAAAISIALLSAADFASATDSVRLDGEWEQGALILGTAPAGSRVHFKGRDVRVSPEGRFVIGLDRDEDKSVELSMTPPDGPAQIERHAVRARKYDIQRLDGLPPDKVTPPAAVTARIEREAVKVRAARMLDTPRLDFSERFVWPCLGRISGIYGSQRILNGTPKQPHYGVDVAVPTGTPVRAPAGGIISLAESDLYYTGGTLMIDHGHGLVSAFLHLSKLEVKLGDEVKQGDVIALSGATGRATGPHLDWRISWFDARVDPQRLVPAMPASANKNANNKLRDKAR